MCKQALALVAHLLGCEIGDAQEVLRLVQLHGEEVPRNARGFAKERGRPLDFSSIIQAVEAVVLSVSAVMILDYVLVSRQWR